MNKVKELEHDIIALNGALGHAIPNNHDGKMSDGSIPKNILADYLSAQQDVQLEKETLCFGNGDFLSITKQKTDTIPCHLEIIAGGEQETDLLDNLVRHLANR